jgi:uncharacterized RDD family membrane protein YckC
VTTPQDPEGSEPPPGYVPAPGGYGYVPEDYRWDSEPPRPAGQGYQTPQPSRPPGKPELAHWVDRAMSGFIDFFGPYLVVLYVNYFGDRKLGSLLFLLVLAWGLYNGYLQGQTGQSVGKRVTGLRTVRDQDGQLIGAGAGFGRAFLHLFDLLPCGLGFLLPLWDSKRQTFADKIMNTVVVRQR